MKKILIATRNKDKFKIVKRLLSTSFKDYSFSSLNDINSHINDEKEVGDVVNRSSQKALNARNYVGNEFDYIVGIDDGIKMKGKMIENVKEYIKPIIEDKYLSQNEKVFIVRAYTFINKEGISKSIITEIPFEYIKTKEKINILEKTYPLSQVLSPIGLSKTITQLNADEANQYYFEYSKSRFDEVKVFFNNK